MNMAPALDPRSALVARNPSISPGGIAGAVIGSLFGGGLLFIVLGFLYFRYRRLSKEAQAEEGVPTTKPIISDRKTSLSGQVLPPGEAPTQPVQGQPSIKDEGSSQPGLTHGDPASSQPYPTYAVSDDSMRGHETTYVQQPDQHNYTGDIGLSSQPHTFPTTQQQAPPLSPDDAPVSPLAANSSYYDPRISMDSDPELPPAAPSRQMTELYEAQLKQSREKKGSTSSFRRIIDYTFKRKRSTHGSSSTPHSARTTRQFFPPSPVHGTAGIKQEADADTSRGVDLRSFPPSGKFTTEPESFTESPRSASPGKQKLDEDRDPGERDARAIPPNLTIRTDSGVRRTTETEPDLPPVDFGPNAVTSPDNLYGLPPAGTSVAAQPPSRVQERLQSPDIPEPMDIDITTDAPDPSCLRTSHSPLLSTETFVSPMKIMNPSTATEKAAYTEYQIENSASPPPMFPPLEVHDDYDGLDVPSIAMPSRDDEVDVDEYLDIPSPDEPRQSGDSFDFSTTPGQSSTDPSSGRTPDTRITISPSPYPVPPPFIPVKNEPESSASPESSRPTPPTGKLICDECGRDFDQIHKLNHHKRYHDRKHNCPYDGCDKKFGTKTHLDRHINDKHLKIKAYHCTDPSCAYFKGGKAFPRKDNWRRHMVKKHQATPAQLEAMDESVG